jgi:nicotinamide riboside kinase
MADIDAGTSGLTVVITGAECSGKTTLALDLARHLGVPWVAEYAREYLAGRAGYAAADLVAIAAGQERAEAGTPGPLIVADTDLLVIRIWSEVRFGGRDPGLDAAISRMLAASRRRFYLLTRPEMPWEPDPLRENPEDRDALHARHAELLEALGVPHTELAGSRSERLGHALAAIADFSR